MKPTDFSVHVTSFLTHYLAAQRNVSPNTIKAYRDVFTLLLRFCRDVQGIALEKLRLERIDVSFVEAFLDYLERERKSSPRTRNQRLTALHAFFRYVQAEEPTRMHQCQQILAIPLRRHTRPTVTYLSKQELAEVLAQPDLHTPEGRRDAVCWAYFTTRERVFRSWSIFPSETCGWIHPRRFAFWERGAECGLCL